MSCITGIGASTSSITDPPVCSHKAEANSLHACPRGLQGQCWDGQVVLGTLKCSGCRSSMDQKCDLGQVPSLEKFNEGHTMLM